MGSLARDDKGSPRMWCVERDQLAPAAAPENLRRSSSGGSAWRLARRGRADAAGTIGDSSIAHDAGFPRRRHARLRGSSSRSCPANAHRRPLQHRLAAPSSVAASRRLIAGGAPRWWWWSPPFRIHGGALAAASARGSRGARMLVRSTCRASSLSTLRRPPLGVSQRLDRAVRPSTRRSGRSTSALRRESATLAGSRRASPPLRRRGREIASSSLCAVRRRGGAALARRGRPASGVRARFPDALGVRLLRRHFGRRRRQLRVA